MTLQQMNFTFGIITKPNADGSILERLFDILKSIHETCENQTYEIIVVGGSVDKCEQNVTWISFDESKKSGWITRKKNLITQNAKYENIV
jgi:hypothetical protein